MKATIAIFLLVFALLAAAPATGPGDSMPTMDQLHQFLQTKKYAELLKCVSRGLALKGKAAEAYPRYELLCLRGEAMLGSRNVPAAADAFAAAAKETSDSEKQGKARGTELLLRRSKVTGYTSRVATPFLSPAATAPSTPPIPANKLLPILEDADRKVAFGALLNDELSVVEPKVRAAQSSEGLPAIIDAVRPLIDLRAIEIAATGKSDQSKKIGQDLAGHAHTIIKQAIVKCIARVDQIRDSSGYSDGVLLYGAGGPTSREYEELANTAWTFDKVVRVATDLAQVTGSADLKADAAESKKLADYATRVYEKDYNPPNRYSENARRVLKR